MPIYTYECPSCSARADEHRHIDKRNDPIHCPKCGVLMNRIPTPTMRPRGGGTPIHYPNRGSQ